MKQFSKAFLLILVLTYVSCESNVFELNDSSANKIYNVPLSANNFIIRIQGNPTTGYQWKVEKSSLESNSSVLESLDNSENGNYVADNANGMVGVGGVYEFKFKPVALGEATIKFTYSRSWEKDSAETLNAHIKVVGESNFSFNTLSNVVMNQEVSSSISMNIKQCFYTLVFGALLVLAMI